MVNQCRCAALFLLGIAPFALALGKVQVYEPAPIYPRSGQYSLRASGTKVPIVSYEEYDYAHFSASDVEIDVHVHGVAPVEKCSLVYSRFDTYHEPTLEKNNRIRWNTTGHHNYYILKVNGFKPLVVAADPLEIDVPPATGSNIFNVDAPKYSLYKDKEDFTRVFKKVLSDATNSMEDSAIVYVPPGVYHVQNLVLPSHTSMYLAPGAVLRLHGDPTDLAQDWVKDSKGRAVANWISTAYNSTDIKIYGRGTIDGKGHKYGKEALYPSLVVPILTDNFIIDGPLLRDSGSTALNVVRSNNVTVRNVKVLNRVKEMLENGGIDLLESQDVIVEDALVISSADTLSTKATKPPSATTTLWPGVAQEAKNILFSHCLAWTTRYGFKVGTGAMSDQSNIRFYSSTIYDSSVAMGIHKKWGHGTVSNVVFDQIIVKHMSYANTYLGGLLGSWIALLIEDGGAGVGPINNVDVKNILVLHKGESQPIISGVEGANVTDVRFDNVYLMKGKGSDAATLKDLGLDNLVYATDVTLAV